MYIVVLYSLKDLFLKKITNLQSSNKLFIFNFFEMHPLMYKATLGHLEFYKSQAINKAR